MTMPRGPRDQDIDRKSGLDKDNARTRLDEFVQSRRPKDGSEQEQETHGDAAESAPDNTKRRPQP
jgi:hypothetical protein